MSKREVELYQAGLVDAVRSDPPLDLILRFVAGGKLLTAYINGWLAGRELVEGV